MTCATVCARLGKENLLHRCLVSDVREQSLIHGDPLALFGSANSAVSRPYCFPAQNHAARSECRHQSNVHGLCGVDNDMQCRTLHLPVHVMLVVREILFVPFCSFGEAAV